MNKMMRRSKTLSLFHQAILSIWLVAGNKTLFIIHPTSKTENSPLTRAFSRLNLNNHRPITI
jgi:hypothetical protein